MSSVLYLILLFSGLWSLSFCKTQQFYVINVNKTWTEAQTHCRVNFNDLATIESQKEMDAVKVALNGTTGHFWIGLWNNSQLTNNSWFWSDGSNFSYTNWDSAEPNNDRGVENCVELRSEYGYRWNDAECPISQFFICYKELPLILINQNRTWREALRYCRENHVDLVSVHTEKVQRWVETAVHYSSTANVWVGLYYTCAQRFWFWVSGSSICYQNWAAGNGTDVEDCRDGERTAAVQTGSKQWISLPEYQKLNFICMTSEEF